MGRFSNVQPGIEWCRRNKLPNRPSLSVDDLKTLHFTDVGAHLRELLDYYNCAFQDGRLTQAQIASLRDDQLLRRIEDEVEAILTDLFDATDVSLSTDMLREFLTGEDLLSLLLYHSNLGLIDSAAQLLENQLTTRLFRLVDTVNLVYMSCDFDDTALEELSTVTRVDRVFSEIRRLIDRLDSRPPGTCPAPLKDWTDDDHFRVLLCYFHEILHQFAGFDLGWTTVESRDANEVVRGDLLYYASEHERTYLRVLGHAASRHDYYEKAILAALFVLGYLAPWSQHSIWKQMVLTGMFPGTSCPMPHAASALANYIAAWQFNDSEAHQYLQAQEIVPVDLLWRDLPPSARGTDDEKAKLICSMLTYFKGSPRRRARGIGICRGLRDLQRMECKEDAPPPDRKSLRRDSREAAADPSAVSDFELEALHTKGLITAGLRAAGDEFDTVIVSAFSRMARRRPNLAVNIVDSVHAASNPSLLQKMNVALAASEIPTDHRQALEAYISERLQEEAEFATEDGKLWGAVDEARDFLSNPDQFIADLEANADSEEEPTIPATLLCDNDFLSDAFAAFHCQADELALEEPDIDREEDASVIHPAYALDDVPYPELGSELERIYKLNTPGALVENDSVESGEALVARLTNKRNETVGFVTGEGTIKSLSALVSEVRSGVRKDVELIKVGSRDDVRSPVGWTGLRVEEMPVIKLYLEDLQ